jgi:nicotinamidase-related amidase
MTPGQLDAGRMTDAAIDTQAAGGTALLIIDMITDLDFDGAETMRDAAHAVADRIAWLRGEADDAGVPVVYVNDNRGQWHSERSRLIEHAMRPEGGGRDLVRKIEPRKDDYFIIKPQFSGFYSTNLPVLLPKLGATRLILTGVSADICVLFTAGDAHMRAYDLWVPADTVAGSDTARTRWALEIMQQSMHAETRSTRELTLAEWLNADCTRNSG